MAEKKATKTKSRRRTAAPSRLDSRFASATLGALGGALVGVLGIVIIKNPAPPIMLSILTPAALGAAGGYRWGDKVHGALWEALLNAVSRG
jgi:hypothetical protein